MRKAFITLLIAASALVLGLNCLAWTKRIPHFRRVVKCGDPSAHFSIIIPRGDDFTFVMVLANVTNLDLIKWSHPLFEGHMEIWQGKNQVFSVRFPTSVAPVPFWLEQEKHLAYISFIQSYGRSPSITKILKPVAGYSVDVAFTKLPPPASELWFSWRESRFDEFWTACSGCK